MLDHRISIHLIHTRLIHHLRISNLRRILITQHLRLCQILNRISSLETFLDWRVGGTQIKVSIWRAAIIINPSCLRPHRLSYNAGFLWFLIHIRNDSPQINPGWALPSWIVCLWFHFNNVWWLYHGLLQLATSHSTWWWLWFLSTAHFVHILAHRRWTRVLLHHASAWMLSTVHLLFLGIIIINLQLLTWNTL